uniref:ATP-dependent DNA helicase RecG n=1 Tax=Candidatus Kentrum sp. FM TaxID=2126340 RepID=A0A450SS14_9GAMM|nr:MAG: ATP-dependent DNA helicase RecG [Candidatus Kentron sp. FM]VFJ56648.1 MAG: ATP-dependent DNA helicase RecG [Candidatus Kentron sp. FM]VFK11192.1 MAG: ATP-dependent DNA helicase RecG [Candidatus Kentron sp. FM]
MNSISTITAEHLEKLLDQGENSCVEFKLEEVRTEALAKEFVAFANSKGGVLLLGVSDEKRFIGVTDPDLQEERICNVARNNVSPPITVEAHRVEVEQKTILWITVPKGKERPYQTRQAQYLIRVGSTNRVATQGELLRLFQAAGMFHHDATEVSGTELRDLNFTQLDQYFQQYDFDFSAEEDKTRLLCNADIMVENGAITVAGLLLFGIHPQRHLAFAGISIARFVGTEMTDELLDRQVIEGPLMQQVDAALAVIKRNLSCPSRIEGGKTVDTRFQYPEKVFRELIVNAVVHRNYAIDGSRIRILMFEDRIEFISPGRLPNSITVEKLRVGVSCAVNPVLLKYMENLRYVDKLGRGLPMVCRIAEKSGKEVILEEFGEEFRVVLEL